MSEADWCLAHVHPYGTHLHGADASSVSRNRRNWGAPTITPNPFWQDQARRLMPEPEFILGPQDRILVLNCVIDTCAYRAWHLFCAHIRTNHVHAILQANVPVEQALAYLKARASFALKSRYPARQRFWTKHGSTRYLWNYESLAAASDYVMNQQGTPMESWMCESIH